MFDSAFQPMDTAPLPRQPARMRSATGFELAAGLSDESSELRFMVLYKGLVSAVRAKALCEEVARRTRRRARVKLDYCRMDMLQDSSLRDQTAELSAHAEVVVFSATSAAALSAELDGWTGEWLRRRLKRARPRAFVLLLNEEGDVLPRNQPALERLRKAAREGWLDLFYQSWGRLPPGFLSGARVGPPGPPEFPPILNSRTTVFGTGSIRNNS